jgi:hypothetical protein
MRYSPSEFCIRFEDRDFNIIGVLDETVFGLHELDEARFAVWQGLGCAAATDIEFFESRRQKGDDMEEAFKRFEFIPNSSTVARWHGFLDIIDTIDKNNTNYYQQ